MTLALYPTSPKPLIGYSVEPLFFTQKTATKSGADVTEKMWDTARYKITLPYRVSVTDAATLLNFHEARYGAYDEFDFIDFHSRAWTGVYIGTGDGVEDTFDMPCTTFDSTTIKVDDVAISAVRYGLSSGGGVNGRGQVIFYFTADVPSDSVITIDFTGKRVYPVRFESDSLRYRTLPQFSSSAEMLELQTSLISQR